MLGAANLFPLLKGWEYKNHILSRTVDRGQTIEYGIPELGWLVNLVGVASDSQLTFSGQVQGADLQYQSFSYNADAVAAFGAFMPDPAGYLERYYKPNPNSTAGIFCVGLILAGTSGNMAPFIPSLKLSLTLELASTQARASGTIYALCVAITNKEKFIRSLRSVLAISNLEIDAALLALGPEGFEGSTGYGQPPSGTGGGPAQ